MEEISNNKESYFNKIYSSWCNSFACNMICTTGTHIKHLFTWLVFNVIFSSLPILTSYIGLTILGTEEEYIIGILCFCFTIISSGTYTYIVITANSKTGNANVGILALSFLILLFFWTTIILLPIVDWMPYAKTNINRLDKNMIALFAYIISIFYAIILNYSQIYSLIQADIGRRRLVDPGNNASLGASGYAERIDGDSL